MESKKNILILIPARYASTRFPGKPLTLISGKPMIQWTYIHCREAESASVGTGLKFQVAVVTDDERIERAVRDFGGQVLRVDDPVRSGSERVALAYQRYFKEASLVLNVQGDEPFLRGKELVRLAQAHLDSSAPLYTMVQKRRDLASFGDPHRVKVVLSASSGRCWYFSRSPIPFGARQWYLHIGVYSYKLQALEQFVLASPSPHEELEGLEQLRALELGLEVKALEVSENLTALGGVDSPGDIPEGERGPHGQNP